MTQACRPLVEELENLLSEPVSSVKQRERDALGELLKKNGDRIVLFGAGRLGRKALAALRSAGLDPLAISDNNDSLWGTEMDGYKVVPPQTAATSFGRAALFIVTIWNPYHIYSRTCAQLEALGCQAVSPVSPIFWRFSDQLLPYFCQDLCHRVYEDADRVIDAAQLWADDESKRQYFKQIQFRALGEWRQMGDLNSDECYFADDLFAISREEVFVDCGAFDGDSLNSFLRSCHFTFESVIAFEADALNYRKLGSFIRTLPTHIQGKIKPMNCAVGARTGVVHFDSIGAAGSQIAEGGAVQVECYRLDDLLANYCPTHIKMDIEGAEYDTLMGAREVISKCRPVLAICVYHTPNDLWRIPLLIRDIVPNYRFHLRMYEGDGWQTVAYAIPAERPLP